MGTASAMALQKKGNYSVILLETENELAMHQTGNNSGVIHSGLYYKPGSLKALNCIEGRRLLYDFCLEHNIKHEQCGKLVVAVTQKDIPALEELERRGSANGLDGLKRLKKDELKEYEPHVSGIAGLYVPQTGIVDYKKVTEAYAKIILEYGGEINTGHRFISLKREGEIFILNTSLGDVKCRFLLNCGGLYSDVIARMCGVRSNLKIIPFRGEYYKVKKEKHHLVKNLIYPVPDPKFPFLGVHFTRMIKGGVEAGPNAVLAFKREGYHKSDFSLKDVAGYAAFPGFWKMASKHYGMGFHEFYRSYNKSAFVKALQKLVPEIQSDDIETGGAGVRAQALDISGKLIDDFRIEESDRMIHVLNAPSPAATASISIGRTIAGMVEKNLTGKNNPFRL